MNLFGWKMERRKKNREKNGKEEEKEENRGVRRRLKNSSRALPSNIKDTISRLRQFVSARNHEHVSEVVKLQSQASPIYLGFRRYACKANAS